ncbi:MAG: fibronectin type III domain-containing protein [Eubacterium sp.]|nr:fibronectin type III domain-containing protein [Eubacterium sp.]
MKRLLRVFVASVIAVALFLTNSVIVCADSVNTNIDKGYIGIYAAEYYSSDNFRYDSSWSRWEMVSDVSQFKDGNDNMYFAYVSSSNKLVVNRLNQDMSTKRLFSIDKAMPNVGTVLADKKYVYVIWGANSGRKQNETAIKICKYNGDGKEIGSVSYTRKEIDAVVPFDAGNCDADISNGVLYCNFSKERFDGHQQGIEIAVNTSNMTKTKGARNFWCSHCFGQRTLVDSNGNVWYVNHGDSYPRAFQICGPDGIREAFHFYCSSSASNDMMILNKTNAEIGGLCETSNGMFFIGISVKGMTEKEYSSQPYNIFITSADGKFTLDEAESRTGTCKGKSYTDTNIKWLTNYSANNSVTDVTAISTNDDTIAIVWEENYNDTYYMILDSRGNIQQKRTHVPGIKFNTCETPLYKDGCLYWIASSPNNRSMNGTYIYKLVLGKVEKVAKITLPAVEGVSYSATQTSIKINWSDVSAAEGYVIQQYKKGKWVDINKIGKDVTSYTISGLYSGQKYRFRIKPYVDVDGELLYGDYINYAIHTK